MYPLAVSSPMRTVPGEIAKGFRSRAIWATLLPNTQTLSTQHQNRVDPTPQNPLPASRNAIPAPQTRDSAPRTFRTQKFATYAPTNPRPKTCNSVTYAIQDRNQLFRPAQIEKPARPNAVCTSFVLLHLLERQTDRLTQRGLAHAKERPALPHPRTNVHIDRA